MPACAPPEAVAESASLIPAAAPSAAGAVVLSLTVVGEFTLSLVPLRRRLDNIHHTKKDSTRWRSRDALRRRRSDQCGAGGVEAMALVAAVALVVVRVVGQDAFYLGWNGREKFGNNSSSHLRS